MDTALNLAAHSTSSLPLQMQKEQSSHNIPLSMDATSASSSSKVEDLGVSAAAGDESQFDESIEDNMDVSHISTVSGGTGRQTTSTKHTSRDSAGSSEGLKGGRRHVSPGARMLIYSGHDSTMVPLLKAIGLYRGTGGSKEMRRNRFITCTAANFLLCYLLFFWSAYAFLDRSIFSSRFIFYFNCVQIPMQQHQRVAIIKQNCYSFLLFPFFFLFF